MPRGYRLHLTDAQLADALCAWQDAPWRYRGATLQTYADHYGCSLDALRVQLRRYRKRLSALPEHEDEPAHDEAAVMRALRRYGAHSHYRLAARLRWPESRVHRALVTLLNQRMICPAGEVADLFGDRFLISISFKAL